MPLKIRKLNCLWQRYSKAKNCSLISKSTKYKTGKDGRNFLFYVEMKHMKNARLAGQQRFGLECSVLE
jgi:hypothetical protein